MTPECRVRVERVLGRSINRAEMAEIDARIDRSGHYLARNDPEWKGMNARERTLKAGAHAAELIEADAQNTVRAFDLNYRLGHAARDVLGPDFDRMVESGRIQFKDRASDLPQYRSGEHDDAIAVTLDDGSVVLFRDRMEPKDVPEVLLHEVGVHSGMAGYLGERGWSDLLGRVQKALDGKDPDAVKYAKRVPDDTPAANYLEEVLAHWVQVAPKSDKFVSSMLGKMRAWIFRHLPFVRGRIKLTNAMLRELAIGSMRRAGKGARKLSRQNDAPIRSVDAETDAGRFTKTRSGVMPRAQFEAEMRLINKNWAPDQIERAYELHKLYAETVSGPAGGAAPSPIQDPAPRDQGLVQQAEQAIEVREAGEKSIVEDADRAHATLLGDAEDGALDLDSVEIVHPETGDRVSARVLLDEIDADQRAVNRLRDCAYPGGRR